MSAAVENRPLSRRQKIMQHLLDNPVALKELRGRMRGARAFIVLTVFLLMLGAFTSLMYVAAAESSTNVSGQVSTGEIGRTLFGGIVAIEMVLVSFIAPAFTAGGISGEREHQTFELLQTTLLPHFSLIMGKLMSSMLYVTLLLLSAIPLQSIAFFFGGVAASEIILSLVIVTVTALLFSTMGIYFSARSKRTLTASLLTYSLAAFIMFGLPIILGSIVFAFGVSVQSVNSTDSQRIMLYAMGFALPAVTALLTQYILINQGTVGIFEYQLSNQQTVHLISPWIPFTILYLALTVLFFYLSVRRVAVIEE